MNTKYVYFDHIHSSKMFLEDMNKLTNIFRRRQMRRYSVLLEIMRLVNYRTSSGTQVFRLTIQHCLYVYVCAH